MNYIDAMILASRLHLLEEPEQHDAPAVEEPKPVSGSILDLMGDH